MPPKVPTELEQELKEQEHRIMNGDPTAVEPCGVLVPDTVPPDFRPVPLEKRERRVETRIRRGQ